LVLREAEDPGSGVPILWLGSHTSYFNKTEAQLIKSIHSFPMFVKSCSNPYWIAEFMAQNSHFLEEGNSQDTQGNTSVSQSVVPGESVKHQQAHRI
jgi:hypothetical protein